MEYQLTQPQDITRMCFVCGEENDSGLHARFYESEQGELVGIFEVHDAHQSYPGRVHGGIAAAMLDETVGRAIMMDEPDIWAVTIELTCKYRKPVPYDKPVVVRGRITRNTSRIFEGAGEIVLEDGSIAVEATGRYLKTSLDKIVDADTLEVDETDMRTDTRPMPATLTIGDA
ncbi:MAG: PaaI family thioesterase [Coriobacteriia bacterium]|nr:PaaI family thioesterase [Coriobacteriia bacterium]